jgi:hypothetical protein
MRYIVANGFMEDKRALFLVRDPRDLLVSQYYSFGYTHGRSSDPTVRARQERNRARIQSLTLDDYVLRAAPRLQERFDILHDLKSHCQQGVLLRYEDLIHNFDQFIEDFTQLSALNAAARLDLYERSRPRDREDTESHKRSGQTGAYSDKLHDETVTRLDVMLERTLTRFGYSPHA